MPYLLKHTAHPVLHTLNRCSPPSDVHLSSFPWVGWEHFPWCYLLPTRWVVLSIGREQSVNKVVYFPIENQGCELLNLTSLTVRKPWMPSLLLAWSLSTWSAICLMFAQHLVSKGLSEKVEKKINISAHLDSLSPFSGIHAVLGRDTSDPCVVRTWRRHSVWLSEQSMAFN